MEQTRSQHQFDENGLLMHPEDWTRELAAELAREESIPQLTDLHWAFIDSLRAYYGKYHVPPPVAMICRELDLNEWCCHDLFHNCLAAWRIAGLPDPGEEAKAYMSAE
jgi:dissimilatory sulfite reductase related protein